MTQKRDKSEIVRRYQSVVSLNERTLKYLQSIGIDSELLETYKALLHFLRTRSDGQVLAMLDVPAKRKDVSSRTTEDDELTDQVIERLTLEQVRDQVTSTSASRRLLERIATVRFGMTRGAISTLKSRDALVEKILTLVSNEGAHSAIARAVESGRNREI